MDIPINAKVECQNHECGKTTCVIVNPIKKVITHVVVQEKGFMGSERLVPLDQIIEATEDRLILRCSRNDLSNFRLFHSGHYIGAEKGFLDYDSNDYYLHPYLTTEFEGSFHSIPVNDDQELIPANELGIHRGSIVHATDGKVGQVDEFIISPVDDKISHLVLREGHVWGRRLVTIPIGEVDRIETDDVHLKLSKKEIEKLPVIATKRYLIV